MIPRHHQRVLQALAAAGLPGWSWSVHEHTYCDGFRHCTIHGYPSASAAGTQMKGISVSAETMSEAVRLAILKASEAEALATYDPYAEWTPDA